MAFIDAFAQCPAPGNQLLGPEMLQALKIRLWIYNCIKIASIRYIYLQHAKIGAFYLDFFPRKAVLAVFDILGLDSDLTREYQRKLSNVLF